MDTSAPGKNLFLRAGDASDAPKEFAEVRSVANTSARWPSRFDTPVDAWKNAVNHDCNALPLIYGSPRAVIFLQILGFLIGRMGDSGPEAVTRIWQLAISTSGREPRYVGDLQARSSGGYAP